MKLFKIVILLLALVPLTSGAFEFYQGLIAHKQWGANLGIGFNDAAINSAFRFLSAIWFGYGVLLLIFVQNLEKYATPLIAMLLIVFLGGIGRIISIIEFGIPEGQEVTMSVVLSIELIIIPFMLIWFICMDKTGRKSRKSL